MRALADRWILRMAWRDSRGGRRRLVLASLSIVVGVAALVAISSFGNNLQQAIDIQARELLGADLSIRKRAAFTPEEEDWLASFPGERARQIGLTSMAWFPRTEDFRLVTVRFTEGGYPWYGKFLTEPAGGATAFEQGSFAIVDDTVMRQFDLQVGDQVRLGEVTFEIAARLLNYPGEAATASMVSPRILIPLRSAAATELLQPGSRANYRVYYRLPDNVDPARLVEDHEDYLRDHRLRWDTVERRKRSLGRAMENLYRFLSLAGFIALLLGVIGIASAVHLFVRQKQSTVAVLRCLGCTGWRAFRIYLVQTFGMAITGAAVGALGGVAVQVVIPWLLEDFLPVEVSMSVSGAAVLQGSLIGTAAAVLTALFPLLPVRRVSPLAALRADFETGSTGRDLLQWAVTGLALFGLAGFAILQTRRIEHGIGFAVGLVIAFGLLALTARLIVWAVRRFFPSSWSYVWRQGLANLYRPRNQTLLMMLALGLGTFLIVTMHLVEESLLNQAVLTGSGDKPNLVFFDIQSDQVDGIDTLLRERGAPILQRVPIVSMRLASVNGTGVEELSRDRRRGRWALNREYRSTYRDHLADTEKVVSGAWVGVAPDGSAPVPISLEQELAGELEVQVGDGLVFNVQGLEVATRVASLRQVEWERIQPNFFAVFPTGVLEKAPQFHVLVTRTETAGDSAELQRAVLREYSNVSAIDLALVLGIVDGIMDKVRFVIQFMALFSILTGLVVLISAVSASRYQRMRETVLLRTLGASTRQVNRILFVEYLFLGTFAALTGLLLALGGSWALAFFVFEIGFVTPPLAIGLAVAAVVLLTILTGIINSRDLVAKPPLEILRQEGN